MSQTQATVLGAGRTSLFNGEIDTGDLTHTLDPDSPVIALPPEFGQCTRLDRAAARASA